jgi:hypothetical protein
MGMISYGRRRDEEDFSLSSITILRSLQCWPLLESAALIDFVCFPFIPADRLFLGPTATRLPTVRLKAPPIGSVANMALF